MAFINSGPEFLTGSISDAFHDWGVFQFGVGWRYRRFTLASVLQVEGSPEFNDDFLSTTQFSYGELDMHSYGGTVEAGWQFPLGRKGKIEPFLGLRYCVILEANADELHRNWRLDADSKLRPTGGARYKYRFSGKSGCNSHAWLFAMLRVSTLKFNNDEYGSGLGIQLSVGIGGDIVVR